LNVSTGYLRANAIEETGSACRWRGERRSLMVVEAIE
jgi:hypothetical protein